VGSPLPFLFGATSTLYNSERLFAQINGLDALDVDILCLQEVVCPRVLRAFKTKFKTDRFHCMHFCHEKGVRYGTTLAWVLICLLVGGLFSTYAAIWLVLTGDLPRFASTTTHLALQISGILVSMVLTAISVHFAVRSSATYVWLTGIPTGLVVFVRNQPRLEVMKVQYGYFEEQHGDFLNLFNPRGYIHISFTLDGARFRLVNTHLNHGDQNCRFRNAQVADLSRTLAYANIQVPSETFIVGDMNVPHGSLELASLCQKNKVHSSMDGDTWCRRNELTRNAFLPTGPSRQLDFILIPNHQTTVNQPRSRLIFQQPPYVSDHFGLVCSVAVNTAV
jgi:endonuclease/exonuclease/phosphatase family metal-dependent hydrolase